MNVEQNNQFWCEKDIRLSQQLVANVNLVSGWCLQVGCTGNNLEVLSVPFPSVIISMSHFVLKMEILMISEMSTTRYDIIQKFSSCYSNVWILICSSQSDVAEYSVCVGYYPLSLGEWFLLLWRNTEPVECQKPLTQWHSITFQKTQLLFVMLITWKIWLKNADGHKYKQVLGRSKILHFTCTYTEVVYTASCLHLSHRVFCRIWWRSSNLMEERCCNIRWRTCKNYVGNNMMLL